jgi:hypothetical protein
MFPTCPTSPLKIYKFKGATYKNIFEPEFKKALARESVAQGVLFDERKPKVENLVTLSL